MTDLELLTILGNVRSTYILEAQSLRAGKPKVHHIRLKRALLTLAAVIALMALLCGTAMAVSVEFREMVFSFLGISRPEIIPDLYSNSESKPENMEVLENHVDIGGAIEAAYIHYPASSLARNGVFLVCTDEVMMNSGNHFDAYYEENGQLIKLEEHTFCQDYSLLGNDIHVEFEWAEYHADVIFTYVDSDAAFRKPNLAGDASAVLMTLEIKLPNGAGTTSYPVLINVRTGELTDICAGTGVEKLPELYQAAISKDLTKLLLVDWDKNIYYVDLAAKQLYRVDELAGEHVDECSLSGNFLSCWVLEGASIEEGKLGSYRAWTIDLLTMERRELFSGIPATAATSHDVWSVAYQSPPEIWKQISGGIELEPLTCEGLHFIEGFNMTSHWGNMYSGSRFAIEVDRGRNVYVIDLSNGEKTAVDGFLWPEMEYPGIECVPSADGEKLLIYTCTEEGYFGSIGVLDFTQKRYTEFSRENLNDLSEHTIYWFDNHSVIVATADKEDFTDYYVYRLLDERN